MKIPKIGNVIRETSSLRSKRFRAVSEQRKTEDQDSRFWPRKKWNESKNPPPPRLLAPFSRGPRSLFRNNTETLATQAMKLVMHVKGDLSSNMCGTRELFVAFRENQW